MKATKPSKKSKRYLSEDADYWQHHTEMLKESGLSRINYCRRNNVNYDRFAYWLSKQKPSRSSIKPLVAVKLKSTSEPSLLTSEALCTLNLRNGNVLKIHDMRVIALILEGVN